MEEELLPPPPKREINNEVDLLPPPPKKEERSFLGAISVLGDFIHYGAKAAEDVFTNKIPEQVATLKLKSNSARLKEYTDIIKRSPELAANLQPEIDRLLKETPELANEISSQKQESSALLKNNVQNLTDVNSVSGFMNWLGTSFGQAGAQIPTSALSFGTSSFLMEAAAVYDGQLELLSQKYGLPKEEIISKGLDKPLEGELYAMLAGSLDAISAGKVLKLFKGIGAGKIGKSTVGQFIKDSSFEALTEGTQGVLEDVGAASGAGTEYTFDFKKFLNEAAAGAVGGGFLGQIGGKENQSEITKSAPKQNELSSIEAEIDNSTSELDSDIIKSIDDSAADNAAFIDALDNLDLGNSSKVADDIAKAELLSQKALQEQQKLESERLRLELSGAPVVPLSQLNVPPAAQDVTRQAEEEQQQIGSEPVNYGLNTKPITFGKSTGEQFEFVDQGGTATGTINKNVAEIDKIYAYKDEQGNVIRGSNLYGKTVDALEAKGVKSLVVVNQSPASQGALQKLVKSGRLEVDPKGTIVSKGSLFQPKGSTTYTKFKIVPKINEQQKTTEQNEKGQKGRKEGLLKVTDPKLTTKVETKPLPVNEPKAEKPVKETPIEKVVKKKEVDTEALTAKYETQLTNAGKRKSSNEKLAAYERIAEKANELGLSDIAAKADKLARETYSEKEDSKELKEERKKLKTKRAEKKAEAAKEEAKEEAPKKVRNLDRKVKISKGNLFKEDTDKYDLKFANSEFFARIAKFTEAARSKAKRAFTKEHQDQYKQGIEEYKQFRRDNGLKEVSDEYIAKQVLLSSDRGAKKIVEEGRQKTRDKSKADAKKAALEAMGLNPEEFDLSSPFDENNNNLSIELGRGIKEASTETLKKENVREVTLGEFIKSLPESFNRKYISKLIPVIQKALSKQGKTLKVFIYKSDNPEADFGMYTTGKNMDVILLSENVIKNNSGTSLHETMHGYFEVVSSALLNTDEKFARSVTRIYDNSKSTFIQSIKNVINNFETASEKDVAIFRATMAYVEAKFGVGAVRILQTAVTNKRNGVIDIETALNAFTDQLVYGFTNHREMLAEVGSSLEFANLLNTIPYNSQYKKDKSFKSVLSELFNELKQRFKSYLSTKEVDTAFEELEYVINNFSDLYLAEENPSFEYDPFYDAPSIGDYIQAGASPKQAALQQRMDALGMSVRKEDEVDFNVDLNVSKTGLNLRKDIIKNLVGTISKIDAIKTFNDVKEYINRVNSRLPKEKQLGDAYALQVLGRINKERVLLAAALDKQKKTISLIKDKHPDYKSDLQLQELVDGIEAIDMKSLSRADRSTLLNGFKSLLTDDIISPKVVNLIVSKGLLRTKLKTLTPVAPKVNKKYNEGKAAFLAKIATIIPTIGKGAGATNYENISSPALFSSILGKFDSAVSDTIFKNVYGRLLKAASKAKEESYNFLRGLEDLGVQLKASTLDFTKVGMYGRIFSTVSSPENKDLWKAEVLENAENVYESSVNKAEAFKLGRYHGLLTEKQIMLEVTTAKEILDALKQNTTMDNILNEKQQKIYNHVSNFFKKHSRSFKRNSIGVHGNTEYEERFNYFPSRASGKVEGDLRSDIDDLVLNPYAKNLTEMLNNPDYTGGTIAAKEAKNALKRNNQKGYFYDFDALSIAQHTARPMLFDMYASLEFKTLSKMLKDPAFKNSRDGFGYEVTNGFLKQLRSIAGTQSSFDSIDRTNAITRSVYKVYDMLTRSIIATIPQFLYQASSGLAASIAIGANINPKTGLKNVSKALVYTTRSMRKGTKENEFLLKYATSIPWREVDFERALNPEDYATGAKGVKLLSDPGAKKFFAKVEDLNFKPTQLGDAWAARAAWFASYLDAGGTLESPDQNAIDRAERVSGVLQNMNDRNFAAPMFKHSTKEGKIWFMMTYMFKGFALNADLSLRQGVANSVHSVEARKVAAAQTAGLIAYRLTQTALVAPILQSLYESLWKKEDDEDDEEKIKRTTPISEALWNSGWDIFMGTGNPAIIDGTYRMLFNTFAAPEIFNPEKEELERAFDQYLDSPIYSPRKTDELLASFASPAVNQTMDLFGDGLEAYNAHRLYKLSEDDESMKAKAELAEQLFRLKIASFSLNTFGGIPIRGDLQKALQGYRKIKKEDMKKRLDNGDF